MNAETNNIHAFISETVIFWVKHGHQNGTISVLRCGGSGGMKKGVSVHPPSLDGSPMEVNLVPSIKKVEDHAFHV